MKNDTEVTEAPQQGPCDGGPRRRLAETLFDGAFTLAYNVGHDIGELTDIVAGLAGRGIMLVPAVGNAPTFATAAAVSLDFPATDTRQYGAVEVQRRFGGGTTTIDRGELTTEEYIEALAAAVKGTDPVLGDCSLEGCDRPAIEAKPGYVGPLFCSPVHAFRANRKAGAVR